MTGKHLYQILLSALCILLAVLICSAAVGIYREGSRRKAENPLETVYTKETVEDAFAHIAPLLIAAVIMTGGGILLGIKDDRREKISGGIRDDRMTKSSGKDQDDRKPADRKTQVILRAVLLAAAVLCIIAGIFNGSMQDVFVKAANICSECIGLG